MLIRDVILSEGYFNELMVVVQDLLIRMASSQVPEISTEKFQATLAKQGYVTTIDELIQAVDQSGYASSVDREKIVPASELPADLDKKTDPASLEKMAGNQAMSDIKSEL